ncbi:MAG: glycosyltransferase, partial [Terriglobia bacterium]
MGATISIIIPALNEAETIGPTLESAAGAPATELIVADGGSTDATAEIARSCGAAVVSSPPGRARQM